MTHMEKKEHDKIIAFDTLFTTNHIQMLKIVMPYLDTSMRKKLAVYIKYQELLYALSYYSSHSAQLCGCSMDSHSCMDKEEFDFGRLCGEILPYCTPQEKQKVEQLAGMFRSMETFREMSQVVEMMQDFAPGTDGDNTGMMDMLMNMLSPEQKSMFEMFGGST